MFLEYICNGKLLIQGSRRPPRGIPPWVFLYAILLEEFHLRYRENYYFFSYEETKFLHIQRNVCARCIITIWWIMAIFPTNVKLILFAILCNIANLCQRETLISSLYIMFLSLLNTNFAFFETFNVSVKFATTK